MSINGVGNSPTVDPTLLQGTAATSSAAKANQIDMIELMQALMKSSQANAENQPASNGLPQPPAPKSFSPAKLSDMMALPSPGALIASLIVDNAAQQRVTNRTTIQAQGEEIALNMEQQADKIREGAITKFACAVAGAVVSMAAGVASIGVTGAGLKAGMDSAVIGSLSQAVSTIVSSAGSMISAGGDLGQSIAAADGKKLEARAERIRTSQELTKQTNEAMRDLIAKTLDFMNAMQANTNQTRSKILG